MRKVALFFAVTIALSASAAQPNDSLNGQYYRLFTPLTFYHNVAGHTLSLAETSLVDEEVVLKESVAKSSPNSKRLNINV